MEKHQNGAGTSSTNSFPYVRPERKTFWQNLALGIWDPEDSKFFGRTKRMWGIVSIFYTIFYAVLAGLFAICMYGLMATIDPKTPKYILGSSLIGTSPGVGFRPLSEREVEGSLVWYNAMNVTDILKWSNNIDNFLKAYNDKTLLPEAGAQQVICDYDKYPKPGQVCAIDMSEFGNCTAENQYAYQHSSPCFFIKLNKIYGWEPEFYNNTNDLPTEMPLELKDHIASLPIIQDQSTNPIQLQKGVRQGDVISLKLLTSALEDVFKLLNWDGYGNKINGEYITHLRLADDIVNMADSLEDLGTMPRDVNTVSQQRNQVWLTCDGDNPADREAMGNISYSPGRGLPGYYYPYTNSPGYLSPLLSVQFLRPKISLMINIECRAWAKNIAYHKSVREAKGSVRFQFMIDHDVHHVNLV